MSQVAQGFHVAAFGFDGGLEGIGLWEFQNLSSKWIQTSEEFLAAHGPVFDASWNGPLAHIKTKLTSASGAALLTFSVHGEITTSIALASGLSADVDASVLEMFVRSLRGVELVRLAASSPEPFKKVTTIEDRPLMIVVPWANQGVSEQDLGVVRDLSIHVAAAFFLQQSR